MSISSIVTIITIIAIITIENETAQVLVVLLGLLDAGLLALLHLSRTSLAPNIGALIIAFKEFL